MVLSMENILLFTLLDKIIEFVKYLIRNPAIYFSPLYVKK